MLCPFPAAYTLKREPFRARWGAKTAKTAENLIFMVLGAVSSGTPANLIGGHWIRTQWATLGPNASFGAKVSTFGGLTWLVLTGARGAGFGSFFPQPNKVFVVVFMAGAKRPNSSKPGMFSLKWGGSPPYMVCVWSGRFSHFVPAGAQTRSASEVPCLGRGHRFRSFLSV